MKSSRAARSVLRAVIRGTGRTRQRLLLPVLTAGIVGVAATVAVAGGSSSKAVIVQPKAMGSAEAKCTARTQPLSGGFSVPDFDVIEAAPARIATLRTDKGWKTEAFNFGEGAGGLVSHAYCGKPKPRIRTKSAE
jgi:hypothetical protein